MIENVSNHIFITATNTYNNFNKIGHKKKRKSGATELSRNAPAISINQNHCIIKWLFSKVVLVVLKE